MMLIFLRIKIHCSFNFSCFMYYVRKNQTHLHFSLSLFIAFQSNNGSINIHHFICSYIKGNDQLRISLLHQQIFRKNAVYFFLFYFKLTLWSSTLRLSIFKLVLFYDFLNLVIYRAWNALCHD